MIDVMALNIGDWIQTPEDFCQIFAIIPLGDRIYCQVVSWYGKTETLSFAKDERVECCES